MTEKQLKAQARRDLADALKAVRSALNHFQNADTDGLDLSEELEDTYDDLLELAKYIGQVKKEL